MSDDVQYEYLTIKAIKGTERKAIEKKQNEGWEFVSQEPGNLIQNTLKFRKVKKPLNLKLIGISVGVVGLFVAVGVIAAVLGGDDKDPQARTPDPTQSSVSASPQPSVSQAQGDVTTATAEPEETATEETITIENNKDFAELVKIGDNCSVDVATFAQKYAGRLISFDGIVNALSPEGSTTTRYRLGLSPSLDVDYGRGPTFQFRDVNLTSDMKWSKNPDGIKVKDTFTFVAKIDKLEQPSCLFLLTPMETTPLS